MREYLFHEQLAFEENSETGDDNSEEGLRSLSGKNMDYLLEEIEINEVPKQEREEILRERKEILKDISEERYDYFNLESHDDPEDRSIQWARRQLQSPGWFSKNEDDLIKIFDFVHHREYLTDDEIREAEYILGLERD